MIFGDYIANAFRSRNSPRQDSSLHLGMKLVLFLNLTLAALYFIYAVTGIWTPDHMTNDQFRSRAIRSSLWIAASSIVVYIYNRVSIDRRPPTLPSSVLRTRGTPLARQESRRSPQSAHD
jgi:hypothetical protein